MLIDWILLLLFSTLNNLNLLSFSILFFNNDNESQLFLYNLSYSFSVFFFVVFAAELSQLWNQCKNKVLFYFFFLFCSWLPLNIKYISLHCLFHRREEHFVWFMVFVWIFIYLSLVFFYARYLTFGDVIKLYTFFVLLFWE